jgi:hypothetical protein
MFWIFNAPICIFLIVHPYIFTTADEHGHAQLHLAWTICNMLQYMNNALHFFLYCLTSPKFRRELLNMLGLGLM